ncbi:MAG: putative pyruvyl transferase EpsO [Chroococcopsis gigantea SAG 12.99]|jgi:pyruvyl transferase EpsO|nr:polysaccharide pyruvyl transferase family protein [Chlorogloea purpurea SAG 13.99]MDV3000234.1 putative pyruvyl transferase EpsO [Chroococcopsis gigantea SAG 12.99]
MSNLLSTRAVKNCLHQSFSVLLPLKECVLLDYPNHSNIGDHLIWLGEILYLTRTAKIDIKYTCHGGDFSEDILNSQSSDIPILLHGGGNLGDIWPKYQLFREKIISQYQDRQIVILPQSIYFKFPENLERTAKIFNSHPDLTIFVRDDNSYTIAVESFFNCRVIKAPDSAFEMVDIPGLPNIEPSSDSILYIDRVDVERNALYSPAKLGIDNLVVEDWIAFQWMNKLPKDWVYIPGLAKLIREGWQRGLATPDQWLSRQKWEHLHPYSHIFHTIYDSDSHRKSWSLMHSAIYQLQKYPFVITNRLHVHILCLLLDIPHVVFPGSYYKIKAFYDTWTHDLPTCKLVEDPSRTREAIEALLQRPSRQ